MNGQQLKQKLRSGDRVYGTHLTSFGNPLTAGWISRLELDFVFFCTEHFPIDRTELALMCKIYGDANIAPMVRIPFPSKQFANMAIEGGAQGIVAPYVETLEEVKDLVGAVKYRPLKGKLLADILDGKVDPPGKMAPYMQEFNKNLHLIIGIESVEAINNLESLLIDGVDGVFLGPHDISCSMGIPEEYGNPEFVATIVDVIRRCRAMNKGVGVHTDLAQEACKPFFDAGMNYVLNNADTLKMMQQMRHDFKELRGRYGDSYSRHAENPAADANMSY